MRIRVSVRDPRTNTPQDVGIDCSPGTRVDEVLALVEHALGVRGRPLVDGEDIDAGVAVGESALVDGSVLDYGRQSGDARPPTRVATVRVVSGPDTGTIVAFPSSGVVRVGRGDGVDLALQDTDVSRTHLDIRCAPAGVQVTDLGSVNHTTISTGRSFAGARNLPDLEAVTLPAGELIQVGGTRLAVEMTREAAVLRPDGAGRLLVNRAPRRRTPAVTGVVELPAQRTEHEPYRMPMLIPMLVPLVGSVLFAVVLSNPLYLLLSVLSPISMGAMWWWTRRTERRRTAAQEADYQRALSRARRTALALRDDEDAHRRQEWPEPQLVLREVVERTTGLWQRKPDDDDWLRIALGTADLPSSITERGTPPPGWEPLTLVAAPHGVELSDVEALGVAGESRWTDGVLDWVIAQLAALHGPDDLSLVVIAPGGTGLAWTRWLPHLRGSDGVLRAAWDTAAIGPLVTALVTQARAATEGWQHSGRRTVHTVVVLANTAALGERDDVTELLRLGPTAGIRFVCVDRDRGGLPSLCRAVLETAAPARLVVSEREDVILAPYRVAPAQTEEVAHSLAPLTVTGGMVSATFPRSVRLADLLPGVDTGTIAAGWTSAAGVTRVPVGLDANGPVDVDISDVDAAHGPHGLVVGMSGSGKSEFLIAMITSLAVHNSPRHLNFLFVDYKGGSTFKDLGRLPHAVGMVTNLSGSPTRLLDSLTAEMTHREKLYHQNGVGNFLDYQRMRAADSGLPAVPRLVVVIDEFAELNVELSDAVDTLVSIGRKGRTAGIHLVLATQQATDVTKQITDNMRLRVCLRVQDVSDSERVLNGRGDAARIPVGAPGRAFLSRTGELREIQPAWSAAPTGTDGGPPNRAVPLRWSDVDIPAAPPAAGPSTARTDLHDVLDAITEATARTGHAAPYRPWHDDLPTLLPLSECATVRHAIPLGRRDEPHQQRQDDFHLPLGTGHLLIVGGAQAGRTTALRSIAVGLTTHAAPADVHLYVIEDSRAFAALDGLPHCGAVVAAEDDERVDRLLSRLATMVRERTTRLAENGAATVNELWEIRPSAAFPHVVLLIDGADVLIDDDARLSWFKRLLADGQRAGLTVCLATRETTLRFRLPDLFEHRLCLRVADRPGQLNLAQRVELATLPPGRAWWLADTTAVQLPIIASGEAGAQTTALRSIVETLAARWRNDNHLPFPVAALPRVINLDEAIALPGTSAGALPVLFGVRGDVLGAHWVDGGKTGGVLTVAGPRRSGRSTAVAAMAISLVRSRKRVVLVRAKLADAHRRAVSEGTDVVTPQELPALLDQGVDAVVIDDADIVALPDSLVNRLISTDGPLLVAAAQLDRVNRFGSPICRVMAASDTGLVLSPSPLNELLGVKFTRAEGFHGPQGRAYFVVDGDKLLGQIPTVD